MTEQQASNAEADRPAPAPQRRRWGKLVFLLIAAGAVYGVYWMQRKAPVLAGWSTDLDAALVAARDEFRPILVVFMDDPPGAIARTWDKVPLGKKLNKQAMDRMKLLKVKVIMTRSARKKWAERFKIAKLPAMLLLDPSGKEANRREGKEVGETAFPREFLTCKVVERAK
jgi:hypothetical protein